MALPSNANTRRRFAVLNLAVVTLLLAACGQLAPPVGETPDVPTVPPTSSPVAGAVATVAVGVTPEGAEAAVAEPEPDPLAGYDPFADVRPLGESGFAIPPTVQHVTETTAQLHFQFETPQPGVVFYRRVGNPPGPVLSLPLDPSYERHIVTLDELTPGSQYEFVVRVGSGDPALLEDVYFQRGLWGKQTFRTPPFGSPVRFAVVGDSGFGDAVAFALSQLIADFDPHFVLHTGDFAYHPEDDADPYAAWRFKYYGPFKVALQQTPFYPVIGNHDYNDVAGLLFDRPFYYWAFPPFDDPAFAPSAFDDARKWYAFAVDDVQFIALDTQTFYGEAGREEQLAWLDERLADTRFAYSIAFFHVPPYTSGFHRDEMYAVRPLAAKLEAAEVPLAFSGHDHNYERLRVGPTQYFVSGGGSQTVYAMEEQDANSEFFATRSHFIAVEMTSENIDIRAVAPDGSVFDEVSLPTPR